jgi:tRNA nucleotidyltransferase (CCA-adding enzyme)
LDQKPPLKTQDLALGGDGIMRAMGVGPSPMVGQATRFLMEQVLDHPEWNTPERLTELLTGFSARP